VGPRQSIREGNVSVRLASRRSTMCLVAERVVARDDWVCRRVVPAWTTVVETNSSLPHRCLNA
jgi:hypothetical protein